MKNRETKDISAGDINGRERGKLGEDALRVNKKSKKQRIEDDGKKLKKKNKEKRVDSSEAEDVGVKKSKKKNKETKVDCEAEDGAKEKSKKKKKKSKTESGSDVIENSESSKADKGIEGNQWDDKPLDDANRKTGKRKRDESDLGVEENTDYKEMKRKSKKKKPTEDSKADENETTKDSKKKSKQSEENNNDSTKEAKKKKKKKQECAKIDKDVATPSSKSTKKVKFSDQVEIFPTEDEESEEEEEVKLVRGKRYSKEEDELIKGSVLEYIENHALGDEGLKMVMECKSHPQIKGCWKEIASAIPWRTYDSVYNRAHTLFEAGSRGVWSKEDLQLVIEFQKKHGNDWRTLADAMGKHRKHVKDAWRRIRLASTNKGHWKREEYQALFDLVNKDLRMKAFQEKHSKHGMLRDNIPWMAISDKLETRDHVTCCGKWSDQLQSPMIAKGIWANVDDYRLLEELLKLDAACIDDVDWDNLLDNRDGEACRKRWNQMVLHIGSPRSKTFAEQVEILSDRYCPDLAEDREDFDNRPYDPEG